MVYGGFAEIKGMYVYVGREDLDCVFADGVGVVGICGEGFV